MVGNETCGILNINFVSSKKSVDTNYFNFKPTFEKLVLTANITAHFNNQSINRVDSNGKRAKTNKLPMQYKLQFARPKTSFLEISYYQNVTINRREDKS